MIHRLDDAVVEYGKQFDSLMTLLKEQVRSLDIVDSFAIDLVVVVVVVIVVVVVAVVVVVVVVVVVLCVIAKLYRHKSHLI